MKFELAEIPALLSDCALGVFSRAATDSIFAGSVRPLASTFGHSTGSEGDQLRASAFAASIQGLSCRLARLTDLGDLPEPLAAHILSEAERGAARGQRILSRLREVLAILSAAGADAVALKGAALVLRGDVDPALRPMGDLDLLLLDPSRITIAAEALERRTTYRRVLSTPRHLVLAEEGERVPHPGGEDPDNPLRIELHRSFRLPVLGVHLDATPELRREAERSREDVLTLPPAMMFRHLWHHAAEDFAARGMRGIQAVDFLDMARRGGPVIAALDRRDASGAATLLYAADGTERLFPGTFDRSSLAELGRYVPAVLRERASQLSVLRHTRPQRAWTKTTLSLAPGPLAKTRFLLRTAFPTPGEVKANIAPGASGLALAGAWIRVLARRVMELFR